MATLLGQSWSGLSRDDEGHREYKLVSRVEGVAPLGPYEALNTPGLPLPGTPWVFGGESDFSARCRPNANITPAVASEPNTQVLVEQTFSTKPLKRCQDETIEDPLLEPADVSGAFAKYNEEATHNRFGVLNENSAFEQLRGPQVEFDRNRPVIKIRQNTASPFLAYVLPAMMIDCVNAFPLWGFAPRCVKLSAAPWQRKFYGLCSVYYERTLEFDINIETFDRSVRDEGTKVLNGHWSNGTWVLDNIPGSGPQGESAAPRRYNPAHFIRYADPQGNPTRVVLNGGVPAGVRVIGIDTITPVIPDRSAVTRATADAAQRASATSLQARRILEDLNAINARGQTPGLPAVIALFETAVTNGNAYTAAANIASRQAGSNAVVVSAGNANVAGQAFMNSMETAKDALVGLSSIPISEATAALRLLSQCNQLALDAVEAYRTSYQALLAARDAQIASGSDTGTGTFLAFDSLPPGAIFIQKYNEADFLLLGIPLFF